MNIISADSPSKNCKRDVGYCLNNAGKDQNKGVIKLNSLNGDTDQHRDTCLKMCIDYPRATGCEIIWNAKNQVTHVNFH